MKITHELCLDHDSEKPGAIRERMDEILAALGHGENFKLKADTPDDTVHGRIIECCFCDTRTIGESIMWHDGVVRKITAENIAAYFEGQGHKLMKLDGDKAYGNTIVVVQVTEADEAPTLDRKTHLKRPDAMPTGEEIKTRLKNVVQVALPKT